MAVSQAILGMNARNFLYIRRLNKRSAKERADDKLATKQRLLAEGVPTTGLLAAFTHFTEVRAFDWTALPSDFVVKPARGYGGEGIIVVRKWDGKQGVRVGGGTLGVHELEQHMFDILDGAYSMDHLGDSAFIEERLVVAGTLKKLSAGGVPDIRVIVAERVPVMAMLRLPTEASGGKGNLQQGAVGVGIDMRTGITTYGVYYKHPVVHLPGTKTKVRGIKVPQWDTILSIAARAQEASGLGFAGIDIVLDEHRGPLVLEVNARPGLKIQLANRTSLRTRLERVGGMSVSSPERGVELAKKLFAEDTLADVPEETNVLHVIEKVTLFGQNGKKVVQAKIDTGAWRTALDHELVRELGLDPHHQKVRIRSGSGEQERHTVRLTMRLRNKEIETVASYNDRRHMRFPLIIGRRDLKGFLVDPTVYPEDVT